MPIFQRIPMLNGLSKSIALVQKLKKMQFFESFLSFPNEKDKKENIQIFNWLIINSLRLASRWQQHRWLYVMEPTALQPRGCIKQPCFEEN